MSVVYHVDIREQCKRVKFLERAKFHVRDKVSLVYMYHVHKYSVILFERVIVTIAIVPIHLCFWGDSPRIYVKNKVLLFFFFGGGHKCLVKQNGSTKHDYNMVSQTCSLKYFEQCSMPLAEH